MQIVVGNFRISLGDLIDDALPHVAGVDEHVLLVHEGHMLPALHGQLEGVTHHTFHAVGGVDGLGGTSFGVPRRTAPPAPQYRPSVPSRTTTKSISPGLASGEVTPLYSLDGRRLTYWSRSKRSLSSRHVRECRLDTRIADCAQQDRVGLLDAFLFLFRKNRTVTQVTFGAKIEILVIEFGNASAASPEPSEPTESLPCQCHRPE